MRVHHRPSVVAPVHPEVEAELGARLKIATDLPAVQVNDRDLLGFERLERRSSRSDRHMLAGARGDVPGCPDHELLGGEPPSGGRDGLTDLACVHRPGTLT